MLCELSTYCLPVPNVPFDAGTVVNNGIPLSSSLESGHDVKLSYRGHWRDTAEEGASWNVRSGLEYWGDGSEDIW